MHMPHCALQSVSSFDAVKVGGRQSSLCTCACVPLGGREGGGGLTPVHDIPSMQRRHAARYLVGGLANGGHVGRAALAGFPLPEHPPVHGILQPQPPAAPEPRASCSICAEVAPLELQPCTGMPATHASGTGSRWQGCAKAPCASPGGVCSGPASPLSTQQGAPSVS